MHPTASALTHKVAKLIELFRRVIALSPVPITSSEFIDTFSNVISAQDWPSTVGKVFIDIPSLSAFTITRANSSL